ncbi:MAG: hypothetical protein QE265_01320 [Rhodoferax sp.]|nr:hypothetical protein [Rhodoferax sp.]
MKRISTSTKATDLFGVGKHGWRDGNLVAAVKATDGEADWFNHLQEELANVVEAAGIPLNPAAFNQLLTALRSAGVFTTAPQFDNSTKAATTAFVAQNAARYQTLTNVSAAGSLNATQFGSIIVLAGSTSFNLNLPALVPGHVGFGFAFMNFNAQAVILSAGTNSIWNGVAGNSGSAIVIQPGDTLDLRTDGYGWFVVSGTTANAKSSGFGASLSSSGYQKLPSGLIMQWGIALTDAAGNATVTLPVAYPTAHRTAVTSGASSAQVTSPSAINSTTLGISASNLSGAGIATNVRWFSIGH